jgi:hypothetical protein
MFISISSTKLSILALQLYFVFSIFYLFPSGYPQPADLIIAAAIGVSFLFCLFSSRWPITAPMAYGMLFAFSTVIINMTHYIIAPDKVFFLSSLYYVFNMGIFIYTYTLYRKHSLALNSALYFGLLVAITLECLSVFVLGMEDEGRAVGTFNNPNQLSYWTLLSFCFLIVLKYPKPLSWFDFGIVFVLLLLEMESLSKAALISFLFIFMCLGFTKSVSPLWRGLIAICGLSLVTFLIFSAHTVSNTVGTFGNLEKTVTRLASIGSDKDDNLDARGYTRIVENPEFLLLGAGEGGYERFSVIPFELHSGVATLFFAYGISGSVIFGLFLLSILKRLPPIYWMLVFALMFYGLTHQNIRFSYFWVFLGLLAAIGDLRHREKVQGKQQQSQIPTTHQ